MDLALNDIYNNYKQFARHFDNYFNKKNEVNSQKHCNMPQQKWRLFQDNLLSKSEHLFTTIILIQTTHIMDYTQAFAKVPDMLKQLCVTM